MKSQDGGEAQLDCSDSKSGVAEALSQFDNQSSFGRKRRFALLIGNSNYSGLITPLLSCSLSRVRLHAHSLTSADLLAGEIPPLANPANDVAALASKLQRDCGFEV